MKYNIATTEGLKEVEGEPIEILGHKCCIHWSELSVICYVTEISTGMRVYKEPSYEMAIEAAKNLFSSHNEVEWKIVARAQLRHARIEYPVNSLI